MTIEERLDQLEKRNKGLTVALLDNGRWLSGSERQGD